MKTFEILVSDGTESGDPPAWMIVDDKDCYWEGVPWHAGETIGDALAALKAAGHLPEGAVVLATVPMHDAYPWQPDGYRNRWTVGAEQ